MRGVASGTSARSCPCRRAIIAAMWRWQFFPWHGPMPARVKAFTTLMSSVASTAASIACRETTSQRQTIVSGAASSVMPGPTR